MLASLPAVAKCSPVDEKSMQWIEFSFSSIEKSFFIEGTCQYSKFPSLNLLTYLRITHTDDF